MEIRRELEDGKEIKWCKMPYKWLKQKDIREVPYESKQKIKWQLLSFI